MRVAILSDIHGNLLALETVLSDAKKRSVERIVCLGDVAADGPQPREVIEFLRSMKYPCVLGNTDEDLASNVPETFAGNIPGGVRSPTEELHDWTRHELKNPHRSYLSGFKPTIEFRLERGPRFLCYHGSPGSNLRGIFATTPDDELASLLEGRNASVFAGGHTHAQMLRRFRESLVVNPGSVGLPMEKDSTGRVWHPARAEYALATFTHGTLGLELLSVPYRLSDLRRAVRRSGIPDPDWWLASWH